MRKFLGVAPTGGAIATDTVAGTGTASATPAPPAPPCSIVGYPLAIVIELTGGKSSPVIPVAQAFTDSVCR
ncbi:hypothetical protein [Nocardia sp. NBC_01388]|uniref:hypothetical protein n=1 Tax=Nocardia sp. NBC_01388 TaxID=2903596 RepID=UPI0032460CE8